MIALTTLRPYTGDHVAPSPNRGARRARAIEGIVLHATADRGNEALSLSWLRSPRSRASCHLLVGRTGRVTRLVGDRQRAWHAGGASWRGRRDVDSVTLGIEIANRNDGEAYTDAQYRRVAAIVAHYCRQGLALADVVGHGDVAAARTANPVGWDWPRFRGMVQQQLRATPDAPAPSARAVERPCAAAATRVDAPSPRPRPAVAARTRHRRTLWLNGVTVLAAGGMLAADAIDLAHRLGVALPEGVTRWSLFAIGVANIVFRLRSMRAPDCGETAAASPRS